MTDAQQMKSEVAAVIREQLGDLLPLPGDKDKHLHPDYNRIRDRIRETETRLRTLVRGNEYEVHEWLAVIHYALADERARLL